MHPERRIRLSKFLSLVLPHRPEQAGVTLDGDGRVAVDALLSGLRESGWEDLTRGEIEEVAREDARRFEAPLRHAARGGAGAHAPPDPGTGRHRSGAPRP